jgi:hypothetical protein
MKLKLYLFSIIVVVFIYANTSIAQTTYSATGSGKWSTMTWNPAGIPGALDNVIIPDADTVTIDQKNIVINDLTIGSGASGILQFSKVDTTSMVVNGNIMVQTGATFKVQTNTITGSTGLLHTLELKGNLTHNGVVFDFRSGSAGSTIGVVNLTLSGNTNSTITLTTPYSTTNGDFNAVTINKTGGAKVILGSNVYMSGGSTSGPGIINTVLTFVNGIIETGPYLWICQTTTELNVIGYSAASYINGSMGRGMSSSAGASKNFPVGDADGLRTLKLRSTTSGAGTGHYAIVRCIPGNANNGSSIFTNGIDKVSKVRYFQIAFNHGLVTTPSMSFDKFSPSYGTDDGVAEGNINLRVAYSIDSLVTWNGLNQTTPHTTTLVAPPTVITPDSLGTAITLNSGVGSIYVALSRVSGSTENTLEKSGTGVNENASNPVGFNLSQNYPNPFNPSTIISFNLPQRSFVTLKIFNLLGKEVSTLINSEKEAGTYNLNFNAEKLSNGVYFYKLTAGNFSSVKKMILMK